MRLPTGEAPAPTVEVEHVPTDALQPLEDASSEAQVCVQGPLMPVMVSSAVRTEILLVLPGGAARAAVPRLGARLQGAAHAAAPGGVPCRAVPATAVRPFLKTMHGIPLLRTSRV